MKARALNDIVEYVERYRGSGQSISMGEVIRQYDSRLITLGIKDAGSHTTRLRNHITAAIPNVYAVKNSRGYYDLIYDDGITKCIEAMSNNVETDMGILSKACKILRRETTVKQ